MTYQTLKASYDANVASLTANAANLLSLQQQFEEANAKFEATGNPAAATAAGNLEAQIATALANKAALDALQGALEPQIQEASNEFTGH